MTDSGKGFGMGGFGSSIFGEVATARIELRDECNDKMRKSLLSSYI